MSDIPRYSNRFYALQKKLLVIMIPVGIALVLMAMTSPVLAQSSGDAENPQRGSIGLEGVVEGEPPSQAARINSPTNGQTFSQVPITVQGTCPAGLIVEVYKNDTFAGSVFCKDDGTFSIDIALFHGENTLYVKVRDLLGQAGPRSNTVTVFYNLAVSVREQLLLLSTVSYRSVSPEEEIQFPLRLSGGKGPYAIHVDWGDGTSDILSRSKPGEFTIRHTYTQAGIYPVVIKASDGTDQTAFLQLTAIVNGEMAAEPNEQESLCPPRGLKCIIWSLPILLILAPLAYWLGIWRQKRKDRLKQR